MGRKIHWIIVLVSIFMIISLSGSVMDLWGRRTVVEKERERLIQLEKKNNELTKKLEMVQTTAFVEKEARERLGMAKEGDTVIIMDDSSTLPSGKSGMTITNTSSGQLPNWKRWWQVFF
jgi:cell division protein FtsB